MTENGTDAPEGTFARLRAMKPAGKKPSNVRKNEPTKKRSNVRSQDTTHYVIHISDRRDKLRRSFDIFKDQQTALEKLQLAAVDAGHKKPKLGDMVQEAIDLYVEKWAKKLPNVRLNKRSNE